MYIVSAIEWHFIFVNIVASHYGICSDRIILPYNISYLTHGITTLPPCNEPAHFLGGPALAKAPSLYTRNAVSKK